jgi:hypothetical protein
MPQSCWCNHWSRPQCTGEGPWRIWTLNLHGDVHGVSSKTCDFNESIVLDWPETAWIGTFLQALKEGRPATQRLWPVDHEHLMATFRQATVELKSLNLGPELYSLRHGGASHDVARRERPLATVKQLGLWKSDSSLGRHEKHSQLQARVHKLAHAQQHVALSLEQNVEKRFHQPVFARSVLSPLGF